MSFLKPVVFAFNHVCNVRLFCQRKLTRSDDTGLSLEL